MENALKAKLVENQRIATDKNQQMQKALSKVNVDIQLVMELNQKLKDNKLKLETELSKEKAKVKEALDAEKAKRQDIIDSLNQDD